MILLVILFTSAVLLLLLSIWRNNRSKKRKAVQREQLDSIFSSLISSYLFEEELRSDVIGKIKRIIAVNVQRRQQLIDLIIKQFSSFSGESAGILRELYTKLGLHQDSIQKLYASEWEIKTKGIHELTVIQVKDAAKQIGMYISSPVKELRMQSILALIELIKFDAMHRLAGSRYKLSEWDQLLLLEKFRALDKGEVPSFRNALHSSNPTVVVFALKLMRMFNQYGNDDLITGLLSHKDKLVVKEAVITAGELLVTDALPALRDLVKHADAGLEMEIIETIGKTGTGEDISFLLAKAMKSNNKLAVKCCKAALAINGNNRQMLEEHLPLNERWEKVIQHALSNYS